MASSSVLFLQFLLRMDSSLDRRVLNTVQIYRKYANTAEEFAWLGLFACFLYEDFGPRTINIALFVLPLGYVGLGLAGVGGNDGENQVGKGALIAMTAQGGCIAFVIPALCLMELFPEDQSRVMGMYAGTHSSSQLIYYSTITLLPISLDSLYVPST